MGKLIGLAAGAGLVSALLFGVVVTGAPAGMLLCYLAPLPIIIVALGWHHLVGLLGVAIGAIAISLLVRPTAGMAFAIAPAFPAWFLAYLALTRRFPTNPQLAPGAGPAWVPPGTLLLWTGLAGAFVAVAAALALGRGDYPAFEGTLREATETLLRVDFGLGGQNASPSPQGMSPATLANLLVSIFPSITAAVFALTLALNLWVAAKAVAISGRLPRPFPSTPDLRMERSSLLAFAAGVLLTLAPGFVGVFGRAVVGGLGMVFALQGLALLHAVTRGRSGRTAMLTLVYILTVFVMGAVPLLGIVGMIDSATPLRQRLSGGARKAS
jgi:hypothetical protein